MLKYVKKAFMVNWNLLALAAGAAVAVISGQPDVVLPLLIAGEVLYLAGLSTRDKFQAAIDAQDHKSQKRQLADRTATQADEILRSLPMDARQRFERVRGMCTQLQNISRGVKGGAGSVVDDMHMSSINRLLWIYLKLLFSKSSLERFFATVDGEEIARGVKHAQQSLDTMGAADGESPGRAKRRASLEDTLKTAEARRDNLQRARENYEYIQLELTRLYTKIANISEMSVNRQDPDFITSEVDSVSASVQQTEKAMGELEFLTGLSAQDDCTPELMSPVQQLES